MTIPFWRPNVIAPERTEWDIVHLNGKPLPGVCTCEIEPARGIETVHEKNTDGTVQKDNGYKGAKVEISVMIWEAGQLQELNQLIPSFHPRKQGGQNAPVTLEHPAALMFNVPGIRVKKLRLPKPSNGFLFLFISAEEWFPDVKASKKRATPGGFPPKDDGGPLEVGNLPPPSPTTGADFPGD